MTNLRSLLLAGAAAAILYGGTARAGSLTLAFDSAPVIAFPGDTVTFSGTVTNLESVVVDLNGCAVSLLGPFTTDNCAIFFDPIVGAPFTLSASGDAGDSAHFDMFTVSVNDPFPGAYGVPYTGTFTITGALEDGSGGSDTNLVQSNFEVEVVPEPGTTALLLIGLPALALLRRVTART